MAKIESYFQDSVAISKITEPENIEIVVFCHGSLCRIPLKSFLESLK